MPSIGTPSSYTSESTCGAPSAYTDAGPPLRTIARGRRARSASTGVVCGTSSEYTRASRTRRAISCEYCPPRSRTRTGRSSRRASSSSRTSATVIRRLLGDGDVVGVALAEPGAGNADEARLLQLVDRLGAAVAHRLAQPADKLADDVAHRPLVRDAALDALRNE